MSAQVPERKYNQISDPDADNIYVNVRINHQAAAGDFATPAFYSVNKNTPFLNNCSNYYCTVTNFAIPCVILIFNNTNFILLNLELKINFLNILTGINSKFLFFL